MSRGSIVAGPVLMLTTSVPLASRAAEPFVVNASTAAVTPATSTPPAPIIRRRNLRRSLIALPPPSLHSGHWPWSSLRTRPRVALTSEPLGLVDVHADVAPGLREDDAVGLARLLA